LVNYFDKSKPGSGVINNWSWDFGDGNASTLQQASHKYTRAGIFSITLSVINQYGCKNSSARKDLVHINKGVTADYDTKSGNICHSPATFSFTPAATGDGSFNYVWTFGDGTSSVQTSLPTVIKKQVLTPFY